MKLTTHNYIKNLLRANIALHNDLSPEIFFVHVTIAEKVIKSLKNIGIIIERERCEPYMLNIGANYFEMCLLRFTANSSSEQEELYHFIGISQMAFPWEDNPTLYITRESFSVLKEFIIKNNFERYIVKIEEQLAISANSCDDQTIKVVTFQPTVYSLNIYERYAVHTAHFRWQKTPSYFYVTFGFTWLQPRYFDHFKIPIEDERHSLVEIILRHLGTLNYTNALSIFDLLRLRIALCDARKATHPTNMVQYEIDFMIRRELTKRIKNNHLDMDEYLMEHDYRHVKLLIDYLVYEFQEFFDTVSRKLVVASTKIMATKMSSTIKLVDETDVRRKLMSNQNIDYTVDGSGYDGMCLSLFLDLCECTSVSQIILDANKSFTSDECELTRFISNSSGMVKVELIGLNTNNFVGDFVRSLRAVTFSRGRISLTIQCNLEDYTIFDFLIGYQLIFRNVIIDRKMLKGLHKCTLLESVITVPNCTFENTCENWQLFNDLTILDNIIITEDEGTWESFFEFVASHLIKKNSKSFRFEKICLFRSGRGLEVDLEPITFGIDELSSKLELRYTVNNRLVDLHELKFGRMQDDKSDYDFYQ